MTVQLLEKNMASRQKLPVTPNANGKAFPPEAYVYQDEVTQKEIDSLRDKVGIDFSSDEWETIDGFGQVVHT